MINRKEVKVAFLDNSIDTSIYNPEEHWKPYLEAELEDGWDSFKATKSQFPDLENGFFSLLSIHGGVIFSTRVDISWVRLLVRIEFIKLKRGVFLSVSPEFQVPFYCCLC